MSTLSKVRSRARLPMWILTHPANRGQRVQALVRSARFQAHARWTGDPTEVRIGRARMLAHLGVPTSTAVVYGSPPDWNEMTAWKHILSPGDRFIDVGANVGVYSLWAADLGAKVTAVEPDSATLRLLRENLALSPDFDIQVVEAACTAKRGRIGFTVGRGPLGSIGEGVEVDAVTLDDLIGDDRVRGVKIDVEGFESIVLAGATRVLSEKRVDAFQLEWNSTSLNAVGDDRRPLAELLADHGYVLMRPDREGHLSPLADVGFGPDVFAVLPHVAT